MNTDLVFADRIQFAFTVMFHYLFPIITMGLGFFIAWLSTEHLLTGSPAAAAAAHFWTRILAITFGIGVVTGIPLEFQFGSNWAGFSAFAGGVFGQTLPLEGTYAFFLESAFIGLFLYGSQRVGRLLHWVAGLGVAVGSWISAYFITAANAWMQHPVGYAVQPNGDIYLTSIRQVLFNPYLGWEFAHVLCGALLAGAFLVTGLGAFYLLLGRHPVFAWRSLRLGVLCCLVFSLLQLFPTGDGAGRNVARYQPLKLAAMEGDFVTGSNAPVALIGMPDTDRRLLLDPLFVPRALSFLAYGSFGARVTGLNSFPREAWPPIELTYYAYHIMVGLGTIFLAIGLLGAVLLSRGRLAHSRWFLWILLLAVPFPLIANEAGWVVAEVGRQPWLIYGLMPTAHGVSPNVSAGETVFTTLGFAGVYLALGLLYLLLVGRVIARGPGEAQA